jgi:hypothetical protein
MEEIPKEAMEFCFDMLSPQQSPRKNYTLLVSACLLVSLTITVCYVTPQRCGT